MTYETVKVGIARVNITPSVGEDIIADYLRLVPAKGIGNELYAKAMVLDDGDDRVAIITADIIQFTDVLIKDIRERVKSLTGIDGVNTLLSASHTHSSPAIHKRDRPSKEYLIELAKKIAGAVYMADQSKHEALIGFGFGEAKVSINRWQKTPTGVRWGPNPDGPIDYEVGVLRIDDLNRRPMGILVNFASHPSIMGGNNLLYSGDYVSYVQSVIEKVYDQEVKAMFCTGAGGDVKIALLTEDGLRFRYGSLEDCRRFGTIIAAEAIKVAEMIKTKPVNKVHAKTMKVMFPLVDLPSIEDVKKELEALRRQVAELEAKGARTDEVRLHINWAETTLAQLKKGTAPRSIPAEVQLIRIGDEIALFAVPGELFVEVGLKLKRAMRRSVPGSFVVAYANGNIGYLPSKRAEENGWCRHDDSYKLSLRPANFSGEIENVLLRAVEEMLKNKRYSM